ncbi:hypothetical protein BCR42DRAFT_92775 [Absidia repens]|uniref:Uncharacterized protein n=1 Tax=Absidia repens TaxID=90262 RepID=A0A1X2IZ53_9FUNG|nr:hypothetical protein BCR42DRAFT_92775 [Absidia repens]
MHHPMYTRHNSISQFNHSTPYTENNYHQQQQQQQQQQEDHLPQLMQHRGSVEADRSKPVFDPMYNVTTYTLPSPTSSPNTPLPVSMSSNPSSTMMAPPPPPTEPNNNNTNNTSVSYHPSSSYPYDYSRLQQQKPQTGNHGRILNLPTLARQEHTSINSLLSNDSPTYHHEAHQQQGHNGQHHQQQHEQQYHPTPDHDLHHSTLSHPDYYGTNAAHGLHHQHHQHSDHNHSSNGSAHLPQPMTRLYSLDDSAMQWI